MDIEKLRKAGYLPDVMMIVLDEEGLPDMDYHTDFTARKGDTVVAEY